MPRTQRCDTRDLVAYLYRASSGPSRRPLPQHLHALAWLVGACMQEPQLRMLRCAADQLRPELDLSWKLPYGPQSLRHHPNMLRDAHSLPLQWLPVTASSK